MGIARIAGKGISHPNPETIVPMFSTYRTFLASSPVFTSPEAQMRLPAALGAGC
jgi:hypothetical protein